MKKLTGLLLSLLTFASQTVFVYSAEINLWQTRRQAISIKPISPDVNRFLASHQTQKSKDARVNDLVAALSASATIESIDAPKTAGSTTPLLIHIQDVHGQRAAQENIAGIISQILEKNPRAFVALEGTSGSIDLSKFRTSSPLINKESASFFFNSGYIQGPEYALLSAAQTPTAIGAENADLYLKNVAAVKEALAVQKDLKTQSEAATARFESEKKTVFGKQLRRLDAERTAWKNATKPMGAYVASLAAATNESLSDYPNIAVFLKTWRLENSIDFDKAERERATFLKALARQLSQSDLDELAAAGAALHANRINHADFHRYLSKLAAKNGKNLNDVPNFQSFIDYALLADSIKSAALLNELSRFEENTFLSLTRTPAERALYAAATQAELTQGLVNLSLTTDEWRRYSTGGTGNNSALKPFEAFYDAAEARNNAIAANVAESLARNDTGVLVTGGFHTGGLDRLFKSKDIIVVRVSPKMVNVESDEGKNYLATFTRERMPLDQIFASQKISLSTPPRVKDGLDPARTRMFETIAPAVQLALARALGGSAFDIAGLKVALKNQFNADTKMTVTGNETRLELPNGIVVTADGKNVTIQLPEQNDIHFNLAGFVNEAAAALGTEAKNLASIVYSLGTDDLVRFIAAFPPLFLGDGAPLAKAFMAQMGASRFSKIELTVVQREIINQAISNIFANKQTRPQARTIYAAEAVHLDPLRAFEKHHITLYEITGLRAEIRRIARDDYHNTAAPDDLIYYSGAVSARGPLGVFIDHDVATAVKEHLDDEAKKLLVKHEITHLENPKWNEKTVLARAGLPEWPRKFREFFIPPAEETPKPEEKKADETPVDPAGPNAITAKPAPVEITADLEIHSAPFYAVLQGEGVDNMEHYHFNSHEIGVLGAGQPANSLKDIADAAKKGKRVLAILVRTDGIGDDVIRALGGLVTEHPRMLPGVPVRSVRISLPDFEPWDVFVIQGAKRGQVKGMSLASSYKEIAAAIKTLKEKDKGWIATNGKAIAELYDKAKDFYLTGSEEHLFVHPEEMQILYRFKRSYEAARKSHQERNALIPWLERDLKAVNHIVAAVPNRLSSYKRNERTFDSLTESSRLIANVALDPDAPVLTKERGYYPIITPGDLGRFQEKYALPNGRIDRAKVAQVLKRRLGNQWLLRLAFGTGEEGKPLDETSAEFDAAVKDIEIVLGLHADLSHENILIDNRPVYSFQSDQMDVPPFNPAAFKEIKDWSPHTGKWFGVLTTNGARGLGFFDWDTRVANNLVDISEDTVKDTIRRLAADEGLRVVLVVCSPGNVSGIREMLSDLPWHVTVVPGYESFEKNVSRYNDIFVRPAVRNSNDWVAPEAELTDVFNQAKVVADKSGGYQFPSDEQKAALVKWVETLSRKKSFKHGWLRQDVYYIRWILSNVTKKSAVPPAPVLSVPVRPSDEKPAAISPLATVIADLLINGVSASNDTVPPVVTDGMLKSLRTSVNESTPDEFISEVTVLLWDLTEDSETWAGKLPFGKPELTDAIKEIGGFNVPPLPPLDEIRARVSKAATDLALYGESPEAQTILDELDAIIARNSVPADYMNTIKGFRTRLNSFMETPVEEAGSFLPFLWYKLGFAWWIEFPLSVKFVSLTASDPSSIFALSLLAGATFFAAHLLIRGAVRIFRPNTPVLKSAFNKWTVILSFATVLVTWLVLTYGWENPISVIGMSGLAVLHGGFLLKALSFLPLLVLLGITIPNGGSGEPAKQPEIWLFTNNLETLTEPQQSTLQLIVEALKTSEKKAPADLYKSLGFTDSRPVDVRLVSGVSKQIKEMAAVLGETVPEPVFIIEKIGDKTTLYIDEAQAAAIAKQPETVRKKWASAAAFRVFNPALIAEADARKPLPDLPAPFTPATAPVVPAPTGVRLTYNGKINDGTAKISDLQINGDIAENVKRKTGVETINDLLKTTPQEFLKKYTSGHKPDKFVEILIRRIAGYSGYKLIWGPIQKMDPATELKSIMNNPIAARMVEKYFNGAKTLADAAKLTADEILNHPKIATTLAMQIMGALKMAGVDLPINSDITVDLNKGKSKRRDRTIEKVKKAARTGKNWRPTPIEEQATKYKAEEMVSAAEAHAFFQSVSKMVEYSSLDRLHISITEFHQIRLFRKAYGAMPKAIVLPKQWPKPEIDHIQKIIDTVKTRRETEPKKGDTSTLRLAPRIVVKLLFDGQTSSVLQKSFPFKETTPDEYKAFTDRYKTATGRLDAEKILSDIRKRVPSTHKLLQYLLFNNENTVKTSTNFLEFALGLTDKLVGDAAKGNKAFAPKPAVPTTPTAPEMTPAAEAHGVYSTVILELRGSTLDKFFGTVKEYNALEAFRKAYRGNEKIAEEKPWPKADIDQAKDILAAIQKRKETKPVKNDFSTLQLRGRVLVVLLSAGSKDVVELHYFPTDDPTPQQYRDFLTRYQTPEKRLNMDSIYTDLRVRVPAGHNDRLNSLLLDREKNSVITAANYLEFAYGLTEELVGFAAKGHGYGKQTPKKEKPADVKEAEPEVKAPVVPPPAPKPEPKAEAKPEPKAAEDLGSRVLKALRDVSLAPALIAELTDLIAPPALTKDQENYKAWIEMLEGFLDPTVVSAIKPAAGPAVTEKEVTDVMGDFGQPHFETNAIALVARMRGLMPTPVNPADAQKIGGWMKALAARIQTAKPASGSWFDDTRYERRAAWWFEFLISISITSLLWMTGYVTSPDDAALITASIYQGLHSFFGLLFAGDISRGVNAPTIVISVLTFGTAYSVFAGGLALSSVISVILLTAIHFIINRRTKLNDTDQSLLRENGFAFITGEGLPRNLTAGFDPVRVQLALDGTYPAGLPLERRLRSDAPTVIQVDPLLWSDQKATAPERTVLIDHLVERINQVGNENSDVLLVNSDMDKLNILPAVETALQGKVPHAKLQIYLDRVRYLSIPTVLTPDDVLASAKKALGRKAAEHVHVNIYSTLTGDWDLSSYDTTLADQYDWTLFQLLSGLKTVPVLQMLMQTIETSKLAESHA